MKCSALVVAVLLVLAPKTGVSSTYYIDFASGSNTNNGTAKGTPWKYAPGMAGWTCTGSCSYTHSEGDQFKFKGGVTWNNTIAPWVITNSGSAVASDYYGVDKTWYAGGSWSNPVFDGGSMLPIPSGIASNGYIHVSGAYVTLDNFTIQNVGVADRNQGNKLIYIHDAHNILIENMVLHPQSDRCISISNGTGTVLSNFEVKNNDISTCGWGMGGGPAYANSAITKVYIHDNVFHDFHDQLEGYVHANTVHFFIDDNNKSTTYLDEVYFYNNRIYGDYSLVDGPNAADAVTVNTAGSGYQVGDVVSPTGVGGSGATFKVYSVDGGGGVTGICVKTGGSGYSTGTGISTTGGSGSGLKVNITSVQTCGVGTFHVRLITLSGTFYAYNNHSTISAGTASRVYWFNPETQYAGSNTVTQYIYNNSHKGDNNTAAFVSTSNSGSTYVMNNVVVGDSRGIMVGEYGDTTNFYSDYNDFYGWSGGAFYIRGAEFYTYSEYLGLGFDAHGKNADPKFVSSTDLHLESGSPVIGQGVNLYSVFTADADGNPRPASGAWDMGAYEFQGTAARPNPPSNLRVTSVN